MAIQLQKGQKIDLGKTSPGLTKAVIGLGWDIKSYDGGSDFDLDASAFLLDANGKCTKETDFIFYNNLQSPCGSVLHTGDNRTGEGEGDDEQLVVDLKKFQQMCTKLLLQLQFMMQKAVVKTLDK